LVITILLISLSGFQPAQGAFVHQLSFGSFGAADGQFVLPRGVAVDGSGNIYVADVGNNRFQVFNSAGVHQLSFGSFGAADGQFNFPFGVAVDGSGNIYVSDTNNNRIQVFNSAGTHQLSFGTLGSADGQFNSPIGVAVDGSGNIYVSDTANHRIQVFFDPLVGGEFIPIETTSLLVANAQSFSWMIPVILSGIGIGLFVVYRKSE